MELIIWPWTMFEFDCMDKYNVTADASCHVGKKNSWIKLLDCPDHISKRRAVAFDPAGAALATTVSDETDDSAPLVGLANKSAIFERSKSRTFSRYTVSRIIW